MKYSMEKPDPNADMSNATDLSESFIDEEYFDDAKYYHGLVNGDLISFDTSDLRPTFVDLPDDFDFSEFLSGECFVSGETGCISLAGFYDSDTPIYKSAKQELSNKLKEIINEIKQTKRIGRVYLFYRILAARIKFLKKISYYFKHRIKPLSINDKGYFVDKSHLIFSTLSKTSPPVRIG